MVSLSERRRHLVDIGWTFESHPSWISSSQTPDLPRPSGVTVLRKVIPPWARVAIIRVQRWLISLHRVHGCLPKVMLVRCMHHVYIRFDNYNILTCFLFRADYKIIRLSILSRNILDTSITFQNNKNFCWINQRILFRWQLGMSKFRK